jgi:DNA helicase-2/ATP-dependent DNA helicase PcrA
MTRARERLYLLRAARRLIFGQEQANLPSRFLKEIPEDLLIQESSARRDHLQGHRTTQRRAPEPHNLAAVSSAFSDVVAVPEPSEEYGSAIYVGMRVRHSKFGIGTIRKIEGQGEDQKVIVWFANGGPKKLLVRFAGLERA